MKYKAIFFDFDYTLGNRDVYAYQLYLRAVNENSSIDDPVLKEAIVQDCMIWDQKGNENKYYVQDLLKQRYGIDLQYDDFSVWWDDHLWEYAVAYDDAYDTVSKLKEKGYLIGMLSNGTSEGQRLKLKHAGLDELFDAIAVSQDIGFKKPDVRLFQHAMDLLNVRPEESVMVGDIYGRDIIGAYRAGMRPVWFCVEPNMPHHADITVIHALSDLLKYF